KILGEFGLTAKSATFLFSGTAKNGTFWAEEMLGAVSLVGGKGYYYDGCKIRAMSDNTVTYEVTWKDFLKEHSDIGAGKDRAVRGREVKAMGEMAKDTNTALAKEIAGAFGLSIGTTTFLYTGDWSDDGTVFTEKDMLGVIEKVRKDEHGNIMSYTGITFKGQIILKFSDFDEPVLVDPKTKKVLGTVSGSLTKEQRKGLIRERFMGLGTVDLGYDSFELRRTYKVVEKNTTLFIEIGGIERLENEKWFVTKLMPVTKDITIAVDGETNKVAGDVPEAIYLLTNMRLEGLDTTLGAACDKAGFGVGEALTGDNVSRKLDRLIKNIGVIQAFDGVLRTMDTPFVGSTTLSDLFREDDVGTELLILLEALDNRMILSASILNIFEGDNLISHMQRITAKAKCIIQFGTLDGANLTDTEKLLPKIVEAMRGKEKVLIAESLDVRGCKCKITASIDGIFLTFSKYESSFKMSDTMEALRISEALRTSGLADPVLSSEVNVRISGDGTFELADGCEVKWLSGRRTAFVLTQGVLRFESNGKFSIAAGKMKIYKDFGLTMDDSFDFPEAREGGAPAKKDETVRVVEITRDGENGDFYLGPGPWLDPKTGKLDLDKNRLFVSVDIRDDKPVASEGMLIRFNIKGVFTFTVAGKEFTNEWKISTPQTGEKDIYQIDEGGMSISPRPTDGFDTEFQSADSDEFERDSMIVLSSILSENGTSEVQAVPFGSFRQTAINKLHKSLKDNPTGFKLDEEEIFMRQLNTGQVVSAEKTLRTVQLAGLAKSFKDMPDPIKHLLVTQFRKITGISEMDVMDSVFFGKDEEWNGYLARAAADNPEIAGFLSNTALSSKILADYAKYGKKGDEDIQRMADDMHAYSSIVLEDKNAIVGLTAVAMSSPGVENRLRKQSDKIDGWYGKDGSRLTWWDHYKIPVYYGAAVAVAVGSAVLIATGVLTPVGVAGLLAIAGVSLPAAGVTFGGALTAMIVSAVFVTVVSGVVAVGKKVIENRMFARPLTYCLFTDPEGNFDPAITRAMTDGFFMALGFAGALAVVATSAHVLGQVAGVVPYLSMFKDLSLAGQAGIYAVIGGVGYAGGHATWKVFSNVTSHGRKWYDGISFNTTAGDFVKGAAYGLAAFWGYKGVLTTNYLATLGVSPGTITKIPAYVLTLLAGAGIGATGSVAGDLLSGVRGKENLMYSAVTGALMGFFAAYLFSSAPGMGIGKLRNAVNNARRMFSSYTGLLSVMARGVRKWWAISIGFNLVSGMMEHKGLYTQRGKSLVSEEGFLELALTGIDGLKKGAFMNPFVSLFFAYVPPEAVVSQPLFQRVVCGVMLSKVDMVGTVKLLHAGLELIAKEDKFGRQTHGGAGLIDVEIMFFSWALYLAKPHNWGLEGATTWLV
ncbi:MAG: hypothetical protein ABIH74_00525, partial [Candidatus Omnitrophota bacterium]